MLPAMRAAIWLAHASSAEINVIYDGLENALAWRGVCSSIHGNPIAGNVASGIRGNASIITVSQYPNQEARAELSRREAHRLGKKSEKETPANIAKRNAALVNNRVSESPEVVMRALAAKSRAARQ